MTLTIQVALLAALSTSAAFAQQGKAVYEKSPDQSKIEGTDRQFVISTVQHGMAEIELGKLAATKAVSPHVKDLANKLQGDQTKITSDLRTVVGERNWTLGGKIQKTDQEQYNKLKLMSGSSFDAAYVGLELDRNTKSEAELTSEASNSKNPDLRDFAQRTKAMVEDHLQVIKDVQKSATAGRTNGGR